MYERRGRPVPPGPGPGADMAGRGARGEQDTGEDDQHHAGHGTEEEQGQRADRGTNACQAGVPVPPRVVPRQPVRIGGPQSSLELCEPAPLVPRENRVPWPTGAGRSKSGHRDVTTSRGASRQRRLFDARPGLPGPLVTKLAFSVRFRSCDSRRARQVLTAEHGGSPPAAQRTIAIVSGSTGAGQPMSPDTGSPSGRRPVATCTALASAAADGGYANSPTPPGAAVDGTGTTSTRGARSMRSQA